VRDAVALARAQLGIQQSSAAPSPSQYITAPVEEGELRRIVTATGTLNAIINVEVGSQLSGQVAELLVDFNDEVKRGQPLARLDQRSFKAHVAEAQAAMELAEVSVEAARARLQRAEIDARDSEAQRAVLKARTDNAKVKLEAAQTELHRKQTLRDRQVGTAVEIEDAQTKVASAAASLREAEAIAAAQENLVAGTQADLRRVKSELESAVASIPQKQALLDVAQIDLDRTTIRSPIDGVIVGRNVNQGQTLATTLEAKTLFIVAATCTKCRSRQRWTKPISARSKSVRKRALPWIPIPAGSSRGSCVRCARRRRSSRTLSRTLSCFRPPIRRTCFCRE
jgi:HlyD family secretion protein